MAVATSRKNVGSDLQKSAEERSNEKDDGHSVVIYTDGACLGNPGPGGWAALLLYGHHEKMVSAGERHTTNNRMELTAALEGLKALKQPCHVELVTDSRYVQQGITDWLPNWRRRNFKTQAGHPVKNQDLWQALSAAAECHQVTWSWVKGHSGHPLNDRVDQAAREEAESIREAD